MAEFTNTALQTVADNANAVYSETAVRGCACIRHREGSGLVTLSGGSGGCVAYRVSFGANIALPTGGTVAPISMAIALDGEALGAATAIVTPAAVEEYGNIFVSAIISVPCGCCVNVSAKNISGAPINVQNANFIVERLGNI